MSGEEPVFPAGHQSGISLRDYFAAMAMQGMFAADTPDSCMSIVNKAKQAYKAADFMLRERAK